MTTVAAAPGIRIRPSKPGGSGGSLAQLRARARVMVAARQRRLAQYPFLQTGTGGDDARQCGTTSFARPTCDVLETARCRYRNSDN